MSQTRRAVLPEVAIASLEAAAFRVPTDRPEEDGTFSWKSTTLIAVHAVSGSTRGFGYSYGSSAAVPLIRDLAHRVIGADALSVEGAWNILVGSVRNYGRPGIAATAISAIDVALWDLKAKLLGVPLVKLLGDIRKSVRVYGSGGFTSYTTEQLCSQLGGWVDSGISRVKMKVGARPSEDVARVMAVRQAIGNHAEIMIDANGAYRGSEAIAIAHALANQTVTWFEEPISSDDLQGLHLLRQRMPPGMALAAGEYGYDPQYFRCMLEARSVDVLQADASRCLGITGFLATARLCQAFCVPLSTHTAPSLHLHPACAVTPLIHVEYFHDHVRIEQMLFEGFIGANRGELEPDRARPGLGIELKSDAGRYAI